MDLSRDRRVTILVSDLEFAAWKKLADEGPFRNLSDFIRCCTNVYASQIVADNEYAEQLEKESSASLGMMLIEANKQQREEEYEIYADLNEDSFMDFLSKG